MAMHEAKNASKNIIEISKVKPGVTQHQSSALQTVLYYREFYYVSFYQNTIITINWVGYFLFEYHFYQSFSMSLACRGTFYRKNGSKSFVTIQLEMKMQVVPSNFKFVYTAMWFSWKN